MKELFITGGVVGLAIAVPVGPIGVLCIRRSLHEGPLVGFTVGMGAAAADAVYGAIAGFGLSAIADFLVRWEDLLGIAGGLLLVAFGLRALLHDHHGEVVPVEGRSLGRAFLGTFLLTLTNPATILSFLAIFAGLGIASGLDYASASLFVLGVLAGSALWWAILANVAGSLRGHLTRDWMRVINRVSGGFVLLFGVGVLGYASWRALS
jgi:threonine/homoserine/homoserine lactone efflux protein